MPDVLPRLIQHRTLGGAPANELSWLSAHGHLRHFDRGGVLAPKEHPIEHLWVVLSGLFAIHVDRGLGPRRVTEWREGDVAGLLPYSRMTSPPGNIVVIDPTELLMVERRHFPELIRECPAVTERLVHLMLDRARVFTSSDLHDEKMESLGRIAAGLAHELNNPASAAARGARLLTETLVEAEHASRSLAESGLTTNQLAAINRVREECTDGAAPVLSSIERADREDVLASWFEAHGADTEASAAFVDTAASIEMLDSLATTVTGEALVVAVQWLAACQSIRALASDVERSASKIHDLVGAVKRFTYMDRHQSPEAMELLPGLRDSVALLVHKARNQSVSIDVDIKPTLPCVKAIGSDLNQVWTNILDNALDAMSGTGRVTVTAEREGDFVVVDITDDGPGIPQEIKERIFDPFFTTKPVGQGTGLGLEISRRLVRRNGGDITVESSPDRTVFRVTVPVAPGD